MPWIDLLDRGPPKDIHTEKAVLACLLLLDDARSWCRQLTPGDFYCGDNEFHGWLFSQIATLAPNDYSGQADIQEAIWKIMTPAYVLVWAGALEPA